MINQTFGFVYHYLTFTYIFILFVPASYSLLRNLFDQSIKKA